MNPFYALLRPHISKLHPAWAVYGLLGLLFFSFSAHAQSGKVFRDFNSNGVQDSPATGVVVGEVGVPGVIVTAYPASGAPVSATTGADGSYTITGLSGTVRLEFTNLQAGDFDSFKGTGNGTSVQFVAAGSTANFGVNYPQNYCGKDTPPVLVPCYVSGDPQTGSDVGKRDVLVSLPYDSQGDTPTHTTIATGEKIGSVYGLAVLRSTQKLFSSAFLKRHVGLGPNGLGAIYLTDLTTNTTSLFTTLSAGSITRDALPTSPPIASYDVAAYPLVGKAGLGDIEISDDEKTLYVVNLFDRKLYSIPVSNPANPTAGTPTSVAIPNPCGSGSYRPFALEYHRGKVYIGIVCTDESAADKTNNANVSGHVYSYDGSTFTEVLTFPLTYAKGATNDQRDELKKWYPWSDDFYAAPYAPFHNPSNNSGNPSYPQPWLTDIEFDVDGTMIIALRDRFGDQTGDNNYGTDPTDANLYRSISNGDILRAGRCGTADLYTLESNGSVCGSTATATGANGEGPGTGEFYDDNVFCCHDESSVGALVIYPGKGEVVNTSLDPLALYTEGLRFFNNVDGTQNRQNGNGGDAHSSGVQIYSDADVFTFGKANGLGDLLMLRGLLLLPHKVSTFQYEGNT